MTAPPTLSLLDVLRTGKLISLEMGAIAAECTRVLGEPDIRHDGDDGLWQIWKYGDLELCFYGEPYRLGYATLHGFRDRPMGNANLAIDPWIIRTGLPIEQFEHGLDDAGIPHSRWQLRIDDCPSVIIGDYAYASFSAGGRNSPRKGLHGLTLPAEFLRQGGSPIDAI